MSQITGLGVLVGGGGRSSLCKPCTSLRVIGKCLSRRVMLVGWGGSPPPPNCIFRFGSNSHPFLEQKTTESRTTYIPTPTVQPDADAAPRPIRRPSVDRITSPAPPPGPRCTRNDGVRTCQRRGGHCRWVNASPRWLPRRRARHEVAPPIQ